MTEIRGYPSRRTMACVAGRGGRQVLARFAGRLVAVVAGRTGAGCHALMAKTFRSPRNGGVARIA